MLNSYGNLVTNKAAHVRARARGGQHWLESLLLFLLLPVCGRFFSCLCLLLCWSSSCSCAWGFRTWEKLPSLPNWHPNPQSAATITDFSTAHAA